ncbi:MAG: hypothetical protein FJY15_04880 [Bacteroidetes bacterium]|nr:hypothetical protein [Bacteroidota bacterium]
MNPLIISIPRTKAELPQMIVAGFMCFVVWSIHYAIFGVMGGFIALFIALAIVGFLYFKLRGDYFVRLDKQGISWKQSIVSKYIFIPWNYMMRVDYLVYEINFQIKESRQVVSFATSGLEDEQTDALKQYISDTVKHIK